MLIASSGRCRLPLTRFPSLLTRSCEWCIYSDPDALRAPSGDWPKLPAAQVHASRGEILRLAGRWDEHQALSLAPCSAVDDKEACGCFSVAKDSEFDRFILNPSVVNSRSRPYSNFTKSLAPGFLLVLAHLPDNNHVMRFAADDLSEMYSQIAVQG